MTTIHDVAKAADVSIATVSRVLNGSGRVSPELSQRVTRAAAAVGYRPNGLARSLRTESTGTIGLIVSNILNPFFTELARAAEDAAIAEGFTVILGNADEIAAKEAIYIRELLEKRVDGLLLNPAASDSPHIREVVERGTPTVLVDRTVDGVDVPLVRAESRPAIRELVKHLTGLGHRRLAIISGPRELRNGLERLEAFVEAVGDAGLGVDPDHLVFGDFERASGAAAMHKLLDSSVVPDAVFVSNGRMALGALEALRARGVRTGKDIALASYDDDPYFALLDPPLTAIAQPTAELGRLAMTTLLSLIREGRSPTPPSLPARLIIRGSCGEP